MPHKHRLAPSSKPKSNYDLPPTTLARPLPVKKPQSQSTSSKPPTQKQPTAKAPSSSRISKPRRKPKQATADDDTPRGFTRLLSAYHPPPRSGLDDGQPPRSKKRKRESAPAAESKSVDTNTFTKPTILPGESLSSYGARVDAALPVAGLGRGKGKIEGLKGEGRKTKAEKKLQRIQREWREEEARRKARREEALEDEEMGSGEELGVPKGKKRKQKKRKGGSDDDEDPWAAIAAKRRDANKEGSGGLVGLHDVVLAPPKFAKAPVEKFKAPAAVGGLKRQAELSDARIKVVEGYRALMKQKLAEGAR